MSTACSCCLTGSLDGWLCAPCAEAKRIYDIYMEVNRQHMKLHEGTWVSIGEMALKAQRKLDAPKRKRRRRRLT